MLNNIKKWLGFTTTKESQPSQTYAQKKENSQKSLSIEREEVKNSPFVIVGTQEHGYWLTMGKHRLTYPYKTKKEVYNQLEKREWSLITSIIIAFIHDRKKVDEAYSYNMGISPDEKSQQMAMDLNHK